MNRHFRSRGACTLAAVSLAVLMTAAPAAARPEPQPTPAAAMIDRSACPLTRIGTQFTRCDDLTGAGKSAPPWVPEQR